jgi:hypothetical protein
MSIYALRELRRFLRGKSLKQVSLTANPGVIDAIAKDKETLRFLERRFRVKIELIPNPSANIEEIKIF